MKLACRVVLVLFCAHLVVAHAGFGRGGSSGSFRSSGSSFSSRSYSAPVRSYISSPRTYSAPKTVVREYHTTTTVAPSSNSGGIHPLTAGIAGYLVGDAMNRHSNQPQQVAQAQPQQQVQQQVQDIPQQQYVSQPSQQQSEEHGLLFWVVLTGLFLFGLGVVLHLAKKN